MSETRRRFDPDFKEGAVRIVKETGKPIAQVARDLGIHEGTLGNWLAKDRAQNGSAGELSVGRAGSPAGTRAGERRAADGA